MLRSASGRVRQIGAWLLLTALAGPLLAGCASRPGPEALTAVETPAPGSKDHVVLVASSRARDPRPGVFYSGERTPALSFARVDISVPPTHKPGMIEWPKQATPNPATDMVVREAVYRDTEQQFSADLKAELERRPPGQRDVFIFVHGYNTLFSEALYRLTQMKEDSRSPAVPVLFTWASRGETADYVYDNNSATAARDRLEETIRLVFAGGAEEVSILAHSMGNWVTVEALRQIKISGQNVRLRSSETSFSPRLTSTSTCSRPSSSASASHPSRSSSSSRMTTRRWPSPISSPVTSRGSAPTPTTTTWWNSAPSWST